PFVRQAAAGSFNFNLGLWVMSIVGWIFILTVIGIPIGAVLLVVSFLGQIIGHIIGTMRATKGRTMGYPFQIKVLRLDRPAESSRPGRLPPVQAVLREEGVTVVVGERPVPAVVPAQVDVAGRGPRLAPQARLG